MIRNTTASVFHSYNYTPSSSSLRCILQSTNTTQPQHCSIIIHFNIYIKLLSTMAASHFSLLFAMSSHISLSLNNTLPLAFCTYYSKNYFFRIQYWPTYQQINMQFANLVKQQLTSLQHSVRFLEPFCTLNTFASCSNETVVAIGVRTVN